MDVCSPQLLLLDSWWKDFFPHSGMWNWSFANSVVTTGLDGSLFMAGFVALGIVGDYIYWLVLWLSAVGIRQIAVG